MPPKDYDPDTHFPVRDMLTGKEMIVPRAESYVTGRCEDPECDITHVVLLNQDSQPFAEVCFTEEQLNQLLGKRKTVRHSMRH